MSWPQRPEAPPPRGYPARNATQGYGNQQGVYPNYQNPTPNNSQPQQQYWQQTQQPHQPQYNQQYTAGQLYQQDYAANNTNQTYPQYNQNYTNQSYQPQQPQTPQQNYYPKQQQQKTTYGAKQTKDGWDDAWEWGWDEAKQAQNQAPTQQQYQQPHTIPQATPQPQAFNNANVIEESFSASDSWNWSVDETPKTTDPPESAVQPQPLEQLTSSTQDPSLDSPQNALEVPQTEEVKTLCDKDVREKLPNLALGKRFHLENLTPQWSIESQMSQDSSDGVQTHSESTYQSESQSRNSTSSPGYNADHINYSHIEDSPHNMDWPQHIPDPAKLDRTSENIVNSMHDMRIDNSNNNLNQIKETVKEVPPPPPSSVASFPTSSMPPSMSPSLPQIPPPLSLPVQSTTSAANLLAPPPTSILPTIPSSSSNPFKNTRLLAHKHIANVPSPSMPSANFSPAPRDIPAGTSLVSPMAVNIMQQARPGAGFGANLETAPDNSERPDQPAAQFRPSPVPHAVPDNLEVAPRSDRNEYLQTAHLSSAGYIENTDFSQNAAPPPGLRRMVVGQQEGEYQNLNLSGDEPPPGLARMVPGQQNESDNIYNQQNDDYLDRQIDGWTDSTTRPYNQADGQQLEDFNQVSNRASRSLDMDRMVPGEPSSDVIAQYSNQSYSVNEQRVVTGVDHDYNAAADIREVNMDGSDYTQPRVNQTGNESTVDFNTEDQQREVTVEGENLEDLSLVSSADVSFSRDQTLEGADLTLDINADRRTDVSDSMDAQASGSRRQSLTHNTSGDDSERDRAFKASPRRGKHKGDREKDKEDRYRDDKKEKEDKRTDRRSDRDRRERDKDRDRPRKDRDVSPEDRRYRRSTRSRKYETEDTDYYSDRERDRRRYREGSYTASSKPPRPDDKDRRHDRDRTRRYATIERDGETRSRRGDRDRHERRYRDIDPSRRHGNLRREEDDERRRAVTFSANAHKYDGYQGPSRSAAPTDEDAPERADRQRRRHQRRHEDYYDESAAAVDAYSAQRAQYEYYERLRRSDPAAYMRVYRQLLAGEQAYPPAMDYNAMGYESRPEERGSVHSGRSSANGYAGNVTWYRGGRADYRDETLRDNASYRTDFSDRDITTDASLNLQLDDSTMRSERMTPLKFATSHSKGSLSAAGQVVLVEGGAVRLVPLATCLPPQWQQASPFIPGVTHKKSVLSLCAGMSARSGAAPERVGADWRGAALLWDLLHALIDHNGVLVGTDIAELLMRDVKDCKANDVAPPPRGSANSAGSRRESSTSGSIRDTTSPPAPPSNELLLVEQSMDNNDPAVLEKFREYMIYGNREQALEWAMSRGLWAHALVASAGAGRVAARFLSALAPRDPLRTLYAAARPAALHHPHHHHLAEGPDGWRSHVAIIIANSALAPLSPPQDHTNPKAENDRKIIINIGDSLASKGLIYCAQFCYLIAGVEFAQHPLAPLSPPPASNEVPRLSLLLAPAHASCWQQVARDDALCATELYEYARALHDHYALPHLQVYKFIMATRLVDAGECTRALAYCEQIAKVLAASPRDYSPALVAQVAALADRLQYFDPGMSEEPPLLEGGADTLPPSPRRHWLRDVSALADLTKVERQVQFSQDSPQHLEITQPAHEPYAWHDQQQYMQPSYPQPQAEGFAEPPAHEEPPQFYQPPPQTQHATMPSIEQQQSQQPLQQPPAPAFNSYSEEWNHAAAAPEDSQGYADNYWPDYSGYGNEEAPRAQITMPGASRTQRPSVHDQESDRDTETSSKSAKNDDKPSKETSKSAADKAAAGAKSGWLGGILNKLSLRPPNQMILPDDKNPTIVWDAASGRWRNTAGDEQPDAPPPPPPTTRDVLARHGAGSPSPPLASGPPPPPGAPVANIFKMQKARHIKKSYVDVLNPGASTRAGDGPAPPAAPAPAPVPVLAPAHNYFVPAPTHHHQAQGDYSYDQQQSSEQWSQ